MQLVHFKFELVFSTNLGKDLYHYLWYCGKKQIECGLAWHWWNCTDLGLIDMSLTNQNAEEAEVVACILLFRKTRHQSNLESIFPHLGGKWRRSEHTHAHPGSASIGGGKKGEFRDWTRVGGLILEPRYKLYKDTNDWQANNDSYWSR